MDRTASRRVLSLIVLALIGGMLNVPLSASGAVIGTEQFGGTWARTDQPVATHSVSRTWMWGPEAYRSVMVEPYVESPSGIREVQYFDKTRMEITRPDGDTGSIWYVTNGLLAKELITGQMQLGDSQFHQFAPAQVNVAGDSNDASAPTYATFNKLTGFQPIPNGWVINQTVTRAAEVGSDDGLSSYEVKAVAVGGPTNHTVASVFWDFMNSEGPVYNGDHLVTDKLFQNPFYATGYPLTEAYWSTVQVAGVPKRVLIQVFERRVLTYTPDNPSGWKVEAGNVGQHYYHWRYVDLQFRPVPVPGTGSYQSSGSVTFPGRVAGVATDTYGNQYVSDYDQGTVTKLDPSGGSQGAISGLSGPIGVFVQLLQDQTFDALYVADTPAHGFVWGFTDGRILPTHLGTGYLSAPAGIVAVGDYVYVTDTAAGSLYEFDDTGHYINSWTGLSNPLGMALGPNGDLFIADSGNNRVLEVTLSGGIVDEWDGFNSPQAVTLTLDGRLFVADTGNNRVVVLRSHVVSQVIGRFGTGVGEFNGPVGLAVDYGGNLYVADFDNHRVERFTEMPNP